MALHATVFRYRRKTGVDKYPVWHTTAIITYFFIVIKHRQQSGAAWVGGLRGDAYLQFKARQLQGWRINVSNRTTDSVTTPHTAPSVTVTVSGLNYQKTDRSDSLRIGDVTSILYEDLLKASVRQTCSFFLISRNTRLGGRLRSTAG